MTILPSRQFPGAVHAFRQATAHPHHRRRFRLIVVISGIVLLLFTYSYILSPSPLPVKVSKPILKPHFPQYQPPSSSPSPPSSKSPPPIQFKPSSFNWTLFPQSHPVPIIHHLPAKQTAHKLPPIQHPFKNYQHSPAVAARQEAVKSAFLRSWNAYKSHAWLADELAPVSGQPKKTFAGWSATLVDALDTLYIMGLSDEFAVAAAAAVQIDWDNTGGDTSCNVFETTIRYLGGLISAYDLSGEHALLEKAQELGDMLLMAFDTPNRLPPFWLHFDNAKNGKQVAGTNDPSASPGSLSLEFTRLAMLTGEDKYFDAVSRVTDFLEKTQADSKLPGMWPRSINFRAESVNGDSAFSLGALADSLYEYLVKMVVLLGDGKGEEGARYKKMYKNAMEVVEEHLIFRPMLPTLTGNSGGKNVPQDILFMGEAVAYSDRVERLAESQHLSCFAGGMFGLGGKVFELEKHNGVGERLARGCGWAYGAFPTGVMPEMFGMVECQQGWKDGPCEWDDKLWEEKTKKPSGGDSTISAAEKKWKEKGFREVRDARYILRPEAIESIFLLYRMTGKEDLRDIAWSMFESVMETTKTPLANSAIKDVTVDGETHKLDSMESFWLAETLKYFYLIFSPPDLISLDEFVFNTEAHPFRRAGVER
ncbi:glycosyl hydrolase [Naviculisporaceae sp. PSN 640]